MESISRKDLNKIRKYVDAEELSKKEFLKHHLYYDNWEGSCYSCGVSISDEEECLVLLKKDLETRRTNKDDGEMLFCEDCYKILLEELFN